MKIAITNTIIKKIARTNKFEKPQSNKTPNTMERQTEIIINSFCLLKNGNDNDINLSTLR